MSSSGITIGGSGQGAGNLLSGNQQNGINLEDAFIEPDNTGVQIEGNITGLDAVGTSTLANGNNGIWQNGADGTTIGGTTALTRNIISGNSSEGISLGTGNNSLVEGNYIGTDLTGTKALGNQIGLEFTNASYATIGGTVSWSGNLISGNNQSGIDCFVIGSTAELIEGNLFGVDVTGAHPLPNINNGIRIAGPTDCTIGGTVASAANVISSNGGDGINLTVGSSSGLVVQGNFIGTDAAGDNQGNQGNGVTVWSDDVTIGGTASGAGNVIAFNGKQGINPAGMGVVGSSSNRTPLGNTSEFSQDIELDGECRHWRSDLGFAQSGGLCGWHVDLHRDGLRKRARCCTGRDRHRYASAEYLLERDGNHVGLGCDAGDHRQHGYRRLRTHGGEHHGHANHHRPADRRRGSPDHRSGQRH